jgi:hypothetical protein
MRKSITVTAIAITLASGLSFAAADKGGQSQSESSMMSGGMHMGMMGDMREMMKECRDMMETAKTSQQQNGESPDAG